MSLLFGKLRVWLEEASARYEGVMGVAVKDLTTGEAILINGDEVFPVASTIKVPILIEFYRRVEAKTLDQMAPVKYVEAHRAGGSGVIKTLTPDAVTIPLIDYATLMINVSDNSSTNYFIDLLGMDKINDVCAQLGLKTTRLSRKMMDMEAFKAGKDSFTTPREMIATFEELYTPHVLTPFVCGETLKMLKKPKEGMVQGVIRNAVPDAVEVADKSGWVGGATLDAGIVYQPRRPYAVALLAKHIPASDLHMVNALNSLTGATRLIQAYFEEVSASTPHGRKL
ncbi:TPA: serine hydrolase [Candidatus Bathyarchaeota archaeon]|nr:serine hydrolase [Candidatus Bathyarchaeota archaeon]